MEQQQQLQTDILEEDPNIMVEELMNKIKNDYLPKNFYFWAASN